eukprot:8580022-Pyramimonas_sp.AAC.1
MAVVPRAPTAPAQPHDARPRLLDIDVLLGALPPSGHCSSPALVARQRHGQLRGHIQELHLLA